MMIFKRSIRMTVMWGILFGTLVASQGVRAAQTDWPLNHKILNEPTVLLSPTGTWHALGDGLNNTVRAIAVVGSDVYAGGEFYNVGGDPNADYIARWDGSAWHVVGDGLNGVVYAITVSGSDIYVGGRFANAGGDPDADKIARWDGSTWHALGDGLDQYTDTVYAIAVSGSDVYVGGEISNAGGIQAADNVVRWDGSAWYPLGGGLYHELGASVVYAIGVSGTNVYVAGNFTNAGGDPNADYIARWDGSVWHALGSGIETYPSSVSAIAIDGGDVYVGGSFNNAGGNPDADKFARWDGSAWHGLGFGSYGDVYAIAVDGSDIYVGGYFTSAGGVETRAIIRYDGVAWYALGSGGLSTTPHVDAIGVTDTDIFVGGAFSETYDDRMPLLNIARWEKGSNPIGYSIFLPIILNDW